MTDKPTGKHALGLGGHLSQHFTVLDFVRSVLFGRIIAAQKADVQILRRIGAQIADKHHVGKACLLGIAEKADIAAIGKSRHRFENNREAAAVIAAAKRKLL